MLREQKRNVVLISGKQGSGKTTLGRSLAEALKRAKRKSVTKKFASPLYEIQRLVYEALNEKSGGKIQVVSKDGEFLQLIGAWGRKRFSNYIWAGLLRDEVDMFLNENPDAWVIVDDLRHEEEFEAFPDAWTVRLEAQEATRKRRAESWRENTEHESEIGLDKFSDQGKFDFYFATEGRRPRAVAEELMKLMGVECH